MTLGSTAWACGPASPPEVVEEILGWTGDGRYLAYRSVGSVGYYEEGGEAKATLLNVYDTVSERTTSYLSKLEDQDFSLDETSEEEQQRYHGWKRLAGKGAFDQWKKSHPLKKGGSANRCGTAEIALQLDDLDAIADAAPVGKWQGATFTYDVKTTVSVLLAVERGGKTFRHLELVQGNRMWANGAAITFSWSPTCNHVAWSIKGRGIDESTAAGRVDDGFFSTAPLLIRPAGPAIHVMAHESATAAMEPVLAALAAAGFPAHSGPNALKARTKSVVYSFGGMMEVAKKIAAAVPGGATVEPLTWKSEADIVVAAGTSALKR